MKKLLVTLVWALWATAQGAEKITVRAAEIPVIYQADAVVAGGSSAAVAAACAAADQGADVVLLAPRPYLGEDLCGRQLLWLEEKETPTSELARSLFPQGRVTTPLTVKCALDQALIKRRIRCLTGCYVSDLLLDKQGRPAGVAMVNRSGCQAVKAKVVIDATAEALLARHAGAKFRAFAPGNREFHFVVVGGELKTGAGISGRKLDVTFKNPGDGKWDAPQPVYEYTIPLPLKENSAGALAQAEQAVRNLVCSPEMQDCSEYAFWFPSDTIIGKKRLEGTKIDAAVFQAEGISQFYVLSQYADIAEKAQSAILRPLAGLEAGEIVGKSAAQEAAKLALATDLHLASSAEGTASLQLGEAHNATLPAGKVGTISAGIRSLPVLGQYDVVVIGGGTAGAPAGIGAARQGAKTLVVEYLDELGGVGTAGLIGSYWYGQRGGFTQEVEDGVGGKKRLPAIKQSGCNVVQKSEWLRYQLLQAGAEIWYNSFGCGALVEQGQVRGVAVATPHGYGVVLAKTIIDASGNADVADCAGAETQFGVTPNGMLAAQLAGYPPRNLSDNLNNTCFALVDDTSVADVWHLMAWCRQQQARKQAYDAGQLLDSRERRRIVADYTLTTPDILNHRSFPDTISHHKSNFDAAAFPCSAMLLIKDMKGPVFEVDLPYRCLLPKGIDGLIVTGLGAGTERDAMTLVRMQSDLQNQGYAAGTAAAMAAVNGGHTRAIDLKKLQKLMVQKGVLQERVLTDKDSYPMSAEAIQAAVANVSAMSSEIKQSRTVEDKSIFSLAVIMAHPAQALPWLQKAYAAAPDDSKKLVYAKILGILGDQTGVPTLISAIRAAQGWDKGYGLTSHRESDNTFSELDREIIALGYSGAADGLKPIVAKLKQLKTTSELSHFTAILLALSHYPKADWAIAPLTQLLREPGFAGHALTNGYDAQSQQIAERDVASTKPETNLNAAFKELVVATMLVRCGDPEGLGRKTLEPYAQGIEGQFARYAKHTLSSSPGR